MPCAILLIVLGLLSAPPGEIVRLRDGTLVHGEIVAFDEAVGVTLARADTGGRLSLRWEHLPPAEVTRIKASRGFTGEDPEPYLVAAVHLVLRNGTTESGVLVTGGPDDVFTLRRRSGTDAFPKSYVATVETGRMEGLEIYARDELYRLMLAEQGTPEGALGHFDMARACEGAGLYEQALDHYGAVRKADPGFKSDLVAMRLQRVTIKIEDAAETAVLDEIRNRLYRRDFEDAAALAQTFRVTYPTSRQAGDLQGLEAEIRRRKREHHGRQIVSDYFSLLEKRVAKIARDPEVTLDIARDLAESAVHADILATLAGSYRLDEATVQELWNQRQGGSVRTYSYGTGTFILGEAKALLFGRFDQDEEVSAPEDTGTADEEDGFDDLVEQVKRRREQEAAERAASAGSKGRALDGEGPTPEEWWAGAPTDDRIRWLMAYTAESSGQLRVIEARGRTCRICDGFGFVEFVNEKGEVERHGCATCKGLKVERLVRYR